MGFKETCAAGFVVTGSIKGKSINKYATKYSVSETNSELIISRNNDEIFQFVLSGIDTFDLLTLTGRHNGEKNSMLILQCVGNVKVITDAIFKFLDPFTKFFQGFEAFRDLALAVVYWDKVFIHLAQQDKNYFDVYPIIKAGRFESDLLAEWLKIKSVQSESKLVFGEINEEIEHAAYIYAGLIKNAREYVNDVTGSVGEVKFDVWFHDLA